MPYSTGFGPVPQNLGTIRHGRLRHPGEQAELAGRTILKGGKVVDPANEVEGEMDVALQDWWTRELGYLGPGARANVTVVDPLDKSFPPSSS